MVVPGDPEAVDEAGGQEIELNLLKYYKKKVPVITGAFFMGGGEEKYFEHIWEIVTL